MSTWNLMHGHLHGEHVVIAGCCQPMSPSNAEVTFILAPISCLSCEEGRYIPDSRASSSADYVCASCGHQVLESNLYASYGVELWVEDGVLCATVQS